MGFFFLKLVHPRERIFLGFHLLFLKWIMITEDIIVADLFFLLNLFLLLSLRLEPELKIIEFVQSIQLLVTDRDAIRENAFAEGLDGLFGL